MDKHYYRYADNRYADGRLVSCWIESDRELSEYIKIMFNDCTFINVGNFIIQIYHCDNSLYILSKEKLPITEEVKTFIDLYGIR